MDAGRNGQRGIFFLDLVVLTVLLVVVGLLLLPALFSARERARRAVCANNLDQIGKAAENYLGIFGNYYPGGLDWKYLYPVPNKYIADKTKPSLTKMEWFTGRHFDKNRRGWVHVVEGDPKRAESDLTGNPALWDPTCIATGHVGFKPSWKPKDCKRLKCSPWGLGWLLYTGTLPDARGLYCPSARCRTPGVCIAPRPGRRATPACCPGRPTSRTRSRSGKPPAATMAAS